MSTCGQSKPEMFCCPKNGLQECPMSRIPAAIELAERPLLIPDVLVLCMQGVLKLPWVHVLLSPPRPGRFYLVILLNVKLSYLLGHI